ncbi:MAG TPA: hypothetical protein VLO13_03150, partial [Halomonas sp.]|nr:hypothetical protein [Halomonas sp.]
TANNGRLTKQAGPAGGDCFVYTIQHDDANPGASERVNRRFIFRIKPIYDQNIPAGDQQQFKVAYTADVLTTGLSGGNVVIDDGSIIIDVTGESNEIRRRIIAKRQRDGRLLGVFDFLLYSGDETFPLCKAGVLYDPINDGNTDISYNLSNCGASTDAQADGPGFVGGEAGVDIEPDPVPMSLEYTTPGYRSFRIPNGVTEISMTVCGAEGGRSASGNALGGRGGCVTNTATGLTPGQYLYLNVGTKGYDYYGNSTYWYMGGSGGGCSYVRGGYPSYTY